ncbi:MAG: hypothetical protein JHC96_05635 [Brevundimonas sp.]|uniref:hypothetical protein n=1 Tax=Brevundimonas sp. TaxID=1871086 RepID=UPI001A1AF57E|nr:hypothetical protein [Brevundimonas sp.]MBJ7318260.1 hypothetical protein [Brevundimonas sp.]
MSESWLPANGTEFELFYETHCMGCVWNGVEEGETLCPLIDNDGHEPVSGACRWICEPAEGGLFTPKCLSRIERSEGEAAADLETALDRADRYAALKRAGGIGRPVIA